MKIQRFGITLLLLMALSFVSCTDFFTTSWAPWAARDPDSLVPKLSSDNVKDLVEQSAGDPDMSLELLKKIKSALKNETDPKKRAKLEAAALSAAVNAVNVGGTLLGQAGDLLKKLNDPANANIDSILKDTLNKMPNLTSTSKELTEIFGGMEKGSDSYNNMVANAKVEDLTLGAVVLLGAEAKKAGVGSDDPNAMTDYLNNFDPDVEKGEPNIDLCLDLSQAAVDKLDGKDDPMADILDGILSGFNMKPTPPDEGVEGEGEGEEEAAE